MRVVFLEDVHGVAQGGDVKEVKNGFARNYLIPKSLAVPESHNALQGVERLKQQAGQTRRKNLADMTALAGELGGIQVNISMRAGTRGRLYGSVTNMMVAEALSTLTGREIDRRIVGVAEPIRELGLFPIDVRLHSEVDASVNVLVHPAGTDPEEYLAALQSAEEEATEAGEDAEAEAEGPAPVVDEAPEAAEESAPVSDEVAEVPSDIEDTADAEDTTDDEETTDAEDTADAGDTEDAEDTK